MAMKIPSLTIGKKTAKYAIIQGGMAIRISMSRLAAAVANAGGIGVIAASGLKDVEELRQEIRKAKNLLAPSCGGLLGVNIMVIALDFWELFQVAIDEGIDVIFVGAGLPTARMYEVAGDIPVVPIISRPGVLRMLVKRYGIIPSAVVVESGKAAGHLGTKYPESDAASIWNLIPEIRKTMEELGIDVPLIAGGAILKGRDIKRAIIDLGASGVQIGTRFAVSNESNACDAWKAVLIAAKGTVLTQSPVGLPGRVVDTPLIRRIAVGVAPKPGDLQRCERCLKECKRTYCIYAHLEIAQEVGDWELGLFFACSRVGEINEILSVNEIFRRLKIGFSLSTRLSRAA